jgi:hypothetical protein
MIAEFRTNKEGIHGMARRKKIRTRSVTTSLAKVPEHMAMKRYTFGCTCS